MKYASILLIVAIANMANAQNSKKYEACCGAEPVDHTYLDMSIFVPNVFTPNKGSLNDLFFPHLNGNVAEVIDFTIFNDSLTEVIYFRNTIVYDKLDNYGWNGLRDGYKEAYIGPFRYLMKIVNKKGETTIVRGRACRLECSDEADALLTNTGCFYPDQVGVNGKVDKTKKTKEKKCK